MSKEITTAHQYTKELLKEYQVDEQKGFNYIIDHKNRAVIAVKIGCANDVVNYLGKRTPEQMWSSTIVKSANPFLPDTIKGVAKCHPDDTFDAEVGKRIARDKVMVKYHNSFDKAIKRVQNKFDEVSAFVRTI